MMSQSLIYQYHNYYKQIIFTSNRQYKMFNFNNWLCFQKEHIRKIYPEFSYNWYVENQHPHRNQNATYHEKMIRCDATKNPYENPTFARTKIKSKNVEEIYMDIRQNRSNFIDDDFPHVQMNVSKDELDTREIQWKRVKDLVKKAVYSLPQDKENKNEEYLSLFKSNNKALQICFTLISRTHPKKLQRIWNRKLNEEGLYEFKLFKDGIIHNVIIDDYVPAYKGFHVFTGPANDIEVYPMLLEKAIAKISGGYSQMPKNPLEIMEMIYCGAIRRQNLDNLRDLQHFRQLVMKTLQKQGLTILVSKTDKKIRQYGINDCQIYQIVNIFLTSINQFNIKLSHNKEQHTLYEILSQNKLSAWNGCFRITDPIWKNVDHAVKEQIFKSMKDNHSFVVVDTEIYRVFEHLIVYQDTETTNKDWLESFSESGYPSFNKFQLKERDEVFIRVTTKQAIQQHLIICRVLGEDSFQFVNGDFSDNAQFLQCHMELQPGNYVICVIQDWVTKKQGQYFIYLSSNCRTVLVPEFEQIQNFLQKLFIEHSSRINTTLQSVFYQELKNIGLGYLRLLVKPPSQIKKIRINFNKIRVNNWQVLPPYDDLQEIVTTTQALIVLKMLRKPPKQLNTFPMQAFVIVGD